MEYYALTGLTTGQLHKLSLLVMQEIGSLVTSAQHRSQSGSQPPSSDRSRSPFATGRIGAIGPSGAMGKGQGAVRGRIEGTFMGPVTSLPPRGSAPPAPAPQPSGPWSPPAPPRIEKPMFTGKPATSATFASVTTSPVSAWNSIECVRAAANAAELNMLIGHLLQNLGAGQQAFQAEALSVPPVPGNAAGR